MWFEYKIIFRYKNYLPVSMRSVFGIFVGDISFTVIILCSDDNIIGTAIFLTVWLKQRGAVETLVYGPL